MGSLINITLNGSPHTIKDNQTIVDILNNLNLSPNLIIIELNENIIKKETYPSTYLKENDQLEIIRYIGGGETLIKPHHKK